MRSLSRITLVHLLGIFIVGIVPVASQTSRGGIVKGPFTGDELKNFAALEAIDAHTHIFQPSPLFTKLIDHLNLHLIDILVADDHGKHPPSLAAQRELALKVIGENADRVALCTTFDPYRFSATDFANNAIVELNKDFDNGAIAVKIWKNIGMEIKGADGRFVRPDDPRLEPIYQDIAEHGKTLIAHLADPDTLWAPPNPKADDYSYYMYEEPWWYMYGRPGAPSKRDILEARDHILEMNPRLRVVGAHLGSLEADLDDLGRHFDRYPNFAVDLAGRVPYFEILPREKAISFIVKYQDRLIYGTDNDHSFSPPSHAVRTSREWEEAYADQWRFFATDDIITYHGQKVKGLALPQSILRKLYHDNAVKWFPGVLANVAKTE
jgi:predicted TIM-barrel fold metal-dependent hydrolase